MTEHIDTQVPETGSPTPGALRRCLAWVVRCGLLVLVLIAVLLSAGRLLAPGIADQQVAIEQQLSGLLGVQVHIGELEASWFRLGPDIAIRDLEIFSENNPEAAHVIASVSLKPDLFKSILSRSLVIEQIILQEPEFDLIQNPDGSWTLAGLTQGEADYTDAIIDFLLNTGRMQIVEAGLHLFWSDGRELALENIYIDLSNIGSRHHASIQARIAGQLSPFLLQLDLTGDPRQQYSATAYLRTTQLEISDLVRLEAFEISRAELSGDFWLTASQGMMFELKAAVSSMNLAGTGSPESSINNLSLDNTSFGFTLRHDSAERWQAWLNTIEFDWQNRPWGFNDLYLDFQDNSDGRPLDIMADSLDLAMVHDVIDDLFFLPVQAASALNDLSPEGELRNILISTDLSGNYDGGFKLQANLTDVAVDAWQGAPAGRGIQGYVEANSNRGFVELDSDDFEVFLPRIFNDSWQYDTANTRVQWSIADGIVNVNSSIIDVSNDYIHGHVQFDLFNHLDSGGEMQSELTLLIGIQELDARYKSLYLPTMENIRTTMEWLDEALLAGNITSSGFISRTSTRGNAPENSGTILSFYNVENGQLRFQPQWPPLSEINAFVSVDNNTAEVSAEGAVIEGIRLSATQASLRPDPEGGSWLTVSGSSAASTEAGMAFLRNTPVRNNIGDFIDEWQGEGSIAVDINLGIPLNNPGRETDVMVNVLSDMSTLTIPEYSLAIDELRGRIVYTSADGLSANALSGKLFDFPIAATIQPITRVDENGNTIITGTRVVGSGRASNSALQAWPGQPVFVRDVLNFAAGEIDYLAEITIPNASEASDTRIRLTSELLGLSLDLPPPFTKTINNIRPLELLISFSDPGQWVSVRFDNRVAANLLISGEQFSGGQVVLGPAASELPFGPVTLAGDGLYFSGTTDSYDYTAWEDAATRFAQMSENSGNGQGGLEDYIGLVDVTIGRLDIIGQTLENVHTRVQRVNAPDVDSESGDNSDTSSWQVQLTNELLSGRFVFPDDVSRPWDINLDYLRFPQNEEDVIADGEAEDEDVLAEVNPGELPDLDFYTQELTIGDKHLGAWEFNLRTDGESASISDLKMTTEDARISDNSGESGANLNWILNDGMHTTSFTGLFSAGDLASVLPGWGYNANVESERAAFISSLQWTGSPAAFDMEKVFGNVQVDIRNGRFVDVDAGTSRLFGAFSFDSLVRRLQLDFSDLYERGLAYDDIRGRLNFNRGIVVTDGPFVINGPSSQITMEGQLNLLQETIDADMLVNVPLGQNLSMLAGILGAWPIAVSTFIASRIFKDQMDDFTTVLYRLEGPWENPTSGFEPSDEILESVIDPAVLEGVQQAQPATGTETPGTQP